MKVDVLLVKKEQKSNGITSPNFTIVFASKIMLEMVLTVSVCLNTAPKSTITTLLHMNVTYVQQDVYVTILDAINVDSKQIEQYIKLILTKQYVNVMGNLLMLMVFVNALINAPVKMILLSIVLVKVTEFLELDGAANYLILKLVTNVIALNHMIC